MLDKSDATTQNINVSRDRSINKNKEYKGNITAKEAGLIVKKMVEDFENNLIDKK